MSEHFDEGDLEETLMEAEANMCVHMTCSEINELIAQRDQLREQNKELLKALNLVPALRPLLLKDLGYVPECVLNITNRARATLDKLS